jgi:hypothetical protein
MQRDHCRGLRKTYSSFLDVVSSNNLSAGALAGLPLYYLAGMMIAYHNTSVATLLSGGSFSFLGALIVSWLVAIICLWRVWPNGLTVSLFILKALGYWSLVSFLVLLFYGIRHISLSITTYLVVILMPEILILLLTADILRAARGQRYKKLEEAAAPVTSTVPQADLNTLSTEV